MLNLSPEAFNQLVDQLASKITESLVARLRADHLMGGQAEEFLCEAAAAKILGLSRATLTAWRYRHQGPPFLRLGAGRRPAVRYKRSDIIAFAQLCKTDPESGR